MKTSAHYRPRIPNTPHGWLPAQTATPPVIVMHFLSRAARGYTWNGNATFKRRGLA